MKAVLPIIFVVLLTYVSTVHGDLPNASSLLSSSLSALQGPKADNSGVLPCDHAFSKCKLKYDGVPKGCFAKANVAVQMGQCWSAQRMNGQKASYFIPYKPGTPNWDAEGGPYGTCLACDWLPNPANDLLATDNFADQCFFWDGWATPVKAPGELIIAMPPICPSNFAQCNSVTWFEPNGALVRLAGLKPNYKGLWFPPKDPATKKPMFCKGLNLGCDTPSFKDLQLAHLGAIKCDITKCKEPSG